MGKLSAKYSEIIRQKLSGDKDFKATDYTDPLAEMTIEWTESVINQMQEKADKYAGHVTQLGQNITANSSESSSDVVSVEVQAPFYWKFFNYGVTGSGNPAPSSHYGTQVFESVKGYKFTSTNPHPDMVQSIRDWIPSTGLFGRLKQEEYESISFGISKNILKRGLESKPFVEDVLDKEKQLDNFTKELADVTQVIFEIMFKDNENGSNN